MYNHDMSNYPEWFFMVLVPILVWTAFWKGLALWHAARQGKSGWFVALVVVNSLGLLEIFFLYQNGKLRPGKLFSK